MTSSSSSSNSPTTFADLHPHIVETHILPRLDGPSLSAAASGSSYLQSLCTQHNLWSQICKSAWPSIAHPRLDDVISTFPDGHRSFFRDSFPSLITEINHHGGGRRTWSKWQPYSPTIDQDRSNNWPPELISAVDIFYQDDIVYSKVKFTDTTDEFLSPALWIELDNAETQQSRSDIGRAPEAKPESLLSRVIDLKVDELYGADDAMVAHLKETMTLNWILIDPTGKRSANLSSIKPVLARKHWMTHEIHLRYVTVLPGSDPNPNEVVQIRIDVTCAVGKGGVGVHVREVVLQVHDLEGRSLSGRDFLVISQGAILGKRNVKRRVEGCEEMERRYEEFLEMRKQKREWVKKEDKKMEMVSWVLHVGVLVCFFFWVYFGILLLV